MASRRTHFELARPEYPHPCVLKALTTFLFRLLTAQEPDLWHIHWKFGYLNMDTSYIVATKMSPCCRNFLDLGLTLE